MTLEEVIEIINKRIKEIEEELWYFIDKNYDSPSEAVLDELHRLKQRIIKEVDSDGLQV